MRSDTFKKWLEEKGCRFDQHERGEGHASVIVKLGGKETILPLIGTHQDLKKEDVERIAEELGLDKSDLPSGEDTITEEYKGRKNPY